MAETEEEALRWKVHLKGFGNNPLKLPQGIRWNGLHLASPLCHSLGAHLLKGGHKKRCVAVGCFLVILSPEFVFFGLVSYFSSPDDAPPPRPRFGDCSPNSRPLEGDAGDMGEAKIIDFASLSLAARPMPGDFQGTLVVFLPSTSAATLISSCKTSAEFTTLWNEKKACNPVTQAAGPLLGSWEKTCGTNPTVTKRTLCYLTVCGSHLIYSLFQMLPLSVSQRGSQIVADWFC